MVESTTRRDEDTIQELIAEGYRDEAKVNQEKHPEKLETDDGNVIGRQIIDEGAWVTVYEVKVIDDLVPDDFYQ